LSNNTDADRILAELEYLWSLEDAVRKFSKKLDEIHADEQYKAVWTLAMVHGLTYQGPTYKDEYASLKRIMESKPDSEVRGDIKGVTKG